MTDASKQDSSASFAADSSLKRGRFKDNSSIFYVSSLQLADFKDERYKAAEVKVQLGRLHVIWVLLNQSRLSMPAALECQHSLCGKRLKLAQALLKNLDID